MNLIGQIQRRLIQPSKNKVMKEQGVYALLLYKVCGGNDLCIMH